MPRHPPCALHSLSHKHPTHTTTHPPPHAPTKAHATSRQHRRAHQATRTTHTTKTNHTQTLTTNPRPPSQRRQPTRGGSTGPLHGCGRIAVRLVKHTAKMLASTMKKSTPATPHPNTKPGTKPGTIRAHLTGCKPEPDRPPTRPGRHRNRGHRELIRKLISQDSTVCQDPTPPATPQVPRQPPSDTHKGRR
jgi:hypothetical protein